MGARNTLGDDDRGSLLTVGAVALVAMLIVASIAVSVGGGLSSQSADSPGDDVDRVQNQVAEDLENANLSASASVNNSRVDTDGPGRDGESDRGSRDRERDDDRDDEVDDRDRRQGPPEDVDAPGLDRDQPAEGEGVESRIPRQAAEEAFDEIAVDQQTELEIMSYLETVASEQAASGQMVHIEPVNSSVDYGLRVMVGDSSASGSGSATANTSRTAVIRTVNEETRTYTTTATESPGPQWTRGEQVDTKLVVVNTTVASESPGQGWQQTEILQQSDATYRYENRSLESPGEGWERLGPNGTREITVNRTLATSSPGPEWEQVEVVSSDGPVYRYMNNRTDPGSEWERVNQSGMTTIIVNRTVAAAAPGDEWEQVEVINRTDPVYRYTESRFKPGDEWEQVNQSGTTTVVTGETIAPQSPGPDWENVSIVERIEPKYETTTSRTDPGRGWERVRQVGTTEVLVDQTVARSAPGPNWENVTVVETVEPETTTTTSRNRPGSEWERVRQVGTTQVQTDTRQTWARSVPGPNWEATGATRTESDSQSQWARSQPGPGYERTSDSRSVQVRTNEQWAQSSPGPSWEATGNYRSESETRTTWSQSRPGWAWSRTGETQRIRTGTRKRWSQNRPGQDWSRTGDTRPRTRTVDTAWTNSRNNAPSGSGWSRTGAVRPHTETQWSTSKPGWGWEKTGNTQVETVRNLVTPASSSPPSVDCNNCEWVIDREFIWFGTEYVEYDLRRVTHEWEKDVFQFKWAQTETTTIHEWSKPEYSTTYEWERSVTVTEQKYTKPVYGTEYRWERTNSWTERLYTQPVYETQPVYRWEKVEEQGYTRARYQLTEQQPVYEWRTVERPGYTRARYQQTEKKPVYTWRTVEQPEQTTSEYVLRQETPTYTWRNQIEPETTLSRYVRTENQTYYDWRLQTSNATTTARYKLVEERPVYRWTRTTTETVTGLEEISMDAQSFAPDNDQHKLLGGAEGLRQSTFTIATATLPVGQSNAATLTAVPAGASVENSEQSWTAAFYRQSDGTAVVDVAGQQYTVEAQTFRFDPMGVNINGSSVDVSTPTDIVGTPFDLYMSGAGDMMGSYSLFATNNASSEMQSVSNVTAQRALASASFDITYQDQTTTYTDRFTVQPSTDPLEDITVEGPGNETNETNQPPEAAFSITELSRSESTITYQIDASSTISDDLITTYDWRVLDHANRVSGLTDGQATQTITVGRTSTDYVLPIELEVVDETGLADTVQQSALVPAKQERSFDPTLDVEVTSLRNTYAIVEATNVDHTDADRYDWHWSVEQGGDLVTRARTSPDRTTRTYRVSRQYADREFVVNLSVEDTATGLDGATLGKVTIPSREGSPNADLTVQSLGTNSTPNSVYSYGLPRKVYRLDGSGSTDPDGSITDLDFQINNQQPSSVSNVWVTDRADDGSWIKVEIQQERDVRRLSASVTATDNDGNADRDQTTIRIDAGGGSPDNLGVSLSEVNRTDDTVTYRVSADESTGYFDWSASGDGSVNGFNDGRGLSEQTFTADRQSDDWMLTVSATRQYFGQTQSGSASVTVPGADDGNDTGPGPITQPEPNIDASLTAELGGWDGDTKVIELNATDTVRNVNIDNWEYDVTVERGALKEGPSDGSALTTVEILPTERGTISADFEVNATDTDSGTSDTARDSLDRVRINLPNTPPQAAVDTNVEGISGTMGTFEIDASDSMDYDGEIVAYEYEVISAKSEETLRAQLTDNQTTQTVDTRILGEGADATIRLTVTDDDNATSSTVFELSNRPEALDVNLEAEVSSSTEDAVDVVLTGSVNGPVSPEDYTKSYSATIDNGSLRNSLDNDAAVQEIAIDRGGGEVQATFEMTVTDQWGRTYNDTATITDDLSRPPIAELTKTKLIDRPQTAKWELSAASTDDPDGNLKSLTYDLIESRSNGDIQGSLTDGVENQSVTVELTRREPDAVIQVTATDEEGLNDTATVELDGDPIINPSPNITDAAANPNPTSIGEETTLWVQTETPQTVEVEHGSSREPLGEIETTRAPLPSFVSANTFPKPNGFITHEFDDGGTQRITFVAQNGSEVDTKQINVEVIGEPEVTNVRQTDVYGQQELDDWPSRQYVAEVEVETDQPAWGEYDVSIEGEYAGSQVPVCRGPVNGNGECIQPSEMSFTGPESTTFLVPLNSAAWLDGATKETVTITVSDDRGNMDRTTVILKEDMSDYELRTSIVGTETSDDMFLRKAEGETPTLDYTVTRNWEWGRVPVSYPAYDTYSGVKIFDNNGNLVAESYENGSIPATRNTLANVYHDLPADMPYRSQYTIKSFVAWNKQGPGDFRLISRNTETLTIDEHSATGSTSSMASSNPVSAVESVLSISQQLQREAEQARSNQQTQRGSSDPRRSDSNTERVTVGEDPTRVTAPTLGSTNPVSAFEGALSTVERLQG